MLDSDPILVLIGFVLLMAGGVGIVQGAVQIAYRLRVPPLLVGFTIVAIGTSPVSYTHLTLPTKA